MRLTIRHTSHYSYSHPVSYALQQVRQIPKPRPSQEIIDWSLELVNAEEEVEFEDQFNNQTLLIRADENATDIRITCNGVVETHNQSGVLGPHRGPMPLWYFHRSTPLTKLGAGVRGLIKEIDRDIDSVEQLHGLMTLVSEQVKYETGQTDAQTTAEEALERGVGVCQDHAHIFVAGARALGFPARYVSGYLMMNDRVEQDAAHAWAEVHIPNLGWVGFDVSNGISPDERYVAVATALDYHGAAPIRGLVYGDHAEELAVRIEVQRQ